MKGSVKGLHTPMRFGGTSVPEQVLLAQKSIFKPANHDGVPRVHLPKENPKYPETKHTVKQIIHNISAYPVTDRPGKESYDPWLGGGKSVVDHYPYTAITAKEVLFNPQEVLAEMGMKLKR